MMLSPLTITFAAVTFNASPATLLTLPSRTTTGWPFRVYALQPA
jgi:hypothetical protein